MKPLNQYLTQVAIALCLSTGALADTIYLTPDQWGPTGANDENPFLEEYTNGLWTAAWQRRDQVADGDYIPMVAGSNNRWGRDETTGPQILGLNSGTAMFRMIGGIQGGEEGGGWTVLLLEPNSSGRITSISGSVSFRAEPVNNSTLDIEIYKLTRAGDNPQLLASTSGLAYADSTEEWIFEEVFTEMPIQPTDRIMVRMKDTSNYGDALVDLNNFEVIINPESGSAD